MKNLKNNSANEIKPQEKMREKNPKKKKMPLLWLFFVLILATVIAFCIGLLGEVLKADTVIVCICIIIFLIVLAFLGDIVAVAGAYAELEYFNAIASRKVKGAKMSISIVKNSDKVSSILSDILGDVCAIISGSVGASLSFIVISNNGTVGFSQSLIAALVGAAISGITVCAKAIAKKIAIKNSTKIVLGFGRFLSMFRKD